MAEESTLEAAPTETKSAEAKAPEPTKSPAGAPLDKAKAGEAPQAPPASSPAKKFKVKIDQEESEVDETELVKGYQRASAANKRFQEAAELKTTYMQLQDAFLKDPLGTIEQIYSSKFGGEKGRAAARHFAERFLGAAKEEEEMPEERRLALKAQKDAEYWREQYERERQRKELEAHEQQVEAEGKKFQDELARKMEAVGLPDDEETLSLLIPILQTSLEKKYPLTAEEAIDIVLEKRTASRKRLLGSLSDDEILEDQERERRLQERILQRTKDRLAKSQGTTSKTGNPKSPTEERRSPAKSASDFFNTWD